MNGMSLHERISLRASCPLWSDSDRIDAPQRTAALCQSRPDALQQKVPLFEDLVGDGEQHWLHGEAFDC
jgi:hypothetical protein